MTAQERIEFLLECAQEEHDICQSNDDPDFLYWDGQIMALTQALAILQEEQ